ncbi:G-protein coupled peptide receptor [Aureococcus anophagefferens]|nr:G-protein coupled peptide receptor [Aureococcus anophagefferens]
MPQFSTLSRYGIGKRYGLAPVWAQRKPGSQQKKKRARAAKKAEWNAYLTDAGATSCRRRRSSGARARTRDCGPRRSRRRAGADAARAPKAAATPERRPRGESSAATTVGDDVFDLLADGDAPAAGDAAAGVPGDGGPRRASAARAQVPPVAVAAAPRDRRRAAPRAPAAMAFERKGAMGQTVIMGVIFLLVFIAYYMLQGYASILFGADLASDALVTLYAVFTAGCFFAPGVVNRFGGKRSLAGGVGRILLDAAARDARHDVGELFAVFWCLFNTSAVLGGFVTFGYFSTQTSSGNAPLYLGFTVLIAAGGAACFLLEDDAVPAARADGPMIDRAAPGALAELASTMRLFGTKRALCLALLFWYTGYNQPYQLNGFGDRFFRKRVVGLQLASFYFMEVVGGFVAGRALDDKSRSHRRSAGSCSASSPPRPPGSGVAGYLEKTEGPDPAKVGFEGLDWALPTLAFAAWGFSDSQVQTYTYWLIGALYPDDAEDRCRMVGFFKLTRPWAGASASPSSRRSAAPTSRSSCSRAPASSRARRSRLELPRDAKPVAADAPLLANEAPGSLQ